MIDQETIVATPPQQVPLCVDMDGSLVKTDTLVESVLSFLRQRPLSVGRVIGWALRGKTVLRHRLAECIQLDPQRLPYNEEVLVWLREQRAAGRQILLVSGADKAVAEPIADFLHLFDAVISADESRDPSGSAKGDVLRERFGPRGFDYVGNSYQDLKVFRESRATILVDPSQGTARQAAKVCSLQHVFVRPSPSWRALVRALRVYQWVKNLLVFLPLIAAHQILNLELAARSAWMCMAFCLCTSGVYVFNDLMDLESDRLHKTKRNRPFASGDLSVLFGLALAPTLLLCGFALAALLSGEAPLVLASYGGLAILYTTVLKRRVLVDVFALSTLYTIRIWAGGAATSIPLSPWLLSFALFIFLSLAFAKRVSELQALEARGLPAAAGRGYLVTDASQLTIFGVASGFIASLVLSLYIDSSTVVRFYERPIFLWALCPIVLFWICRVWMLAHRGELDEDPITFTIRDPVTYWLGVTIALVLLVATKDWFQALH